MCETAHKINAWRKNSTSQTKRVLRLTHSEICCCSSPLSDRHQCRGTISKGDLNISLGIGAVVVLRNAAARLFSPRSNSSVGAEKEISPQHPSHACSWPEPQLSEKMLMQALSVFSERRHALFKPASVWRRGGSSLPHHPFHCSHPYSSSGLSVCSSTQDWRLAWPMGGLLPSPRHFPTPWCRARKIEFSSSTPPLLTQHYKVWQPIHSLFLAESDKGEEARWAGFSCERGGKKSDLQRRLKRCRDSMSRWWRRWSDLRQRALRHPPSFYSFPPPPIP